VSWTILSILFSDQINIVFVFEAVLSAIEAACRLAPTDKSFERGEPIAGVVQYFFIFVELR